VTVEKRIISNTLVAYAVLVASAAITFWLVPYLIRHLGVITYGVIGIIGSILQLTGPIDSGLRPAVLRQFTRFRAESDPDRANRLASNALVVYVALAAALLGVLILSGRWLLQTLNTPAHLLTEAYVVLLAAGLSAGLGLTSAIYGAVLGSGLRFDLQYLSRTAGQFAQAAVIVSLFTLWKPALSVWGLASVVGGTLVLLLLSRLAHGLVRDLRVQLALTDRYGLRDLLGFGTLTALSSLAQWLSIYSGPILLAYYIGPEAVARYSPVIAIMVRLQPLWNSWLWQLQPIITMAQADRDLPRTYPVVLSTTRYAIIVGGGALVTLASWADPLIRLWLGSGFESTAAVLSGWAVIRLFHVVNGTSQSICLGTGQMRRVARIDMILSVVCVVLTGILLAGLHPGVTAPVVALLVTEPIRALLLLSVSMRLLRIGRWTYIREAILRPSSCLVILALAGLLLGDLCEIDSWASALLVISIQLAVYAACVWTVGLTVDDRKALWRYLRPQ
jgi:O-antigen/teichoic acid export membrane protein